MIKSKNIWKNLRIACPDCFSINTFFWIRTKKKAVFKCQDCNNYFKIDENEIKYLDKKGIKYRDITDFL